jgi:hypothetical protein
MMMASSRTTAAPCGLVLVLLALAAAGLSDACTVTVDNQYNVSLGLFSYDGQDGSCAIPYYGYQVDARSGSVLLRGSIDRSIRMTRSCLTHA